MISAESVVTKEETDRVHYTLKEYKNIINYEQTKETLKNNV